MSDYRVVRLKTPADCEGFAQNVDEKYPDLAKQARRRAVELLAGTHGATSDAEIEALQAVHAFEEVRRQQTGKKTRATRTWQSINRNGIIPTVESVVSRKIPTEEFPALVEAGMDDFTFESVVLRHQDQFSPEAIEQAKKRIDERQAGG